MSEETPVARSTDCAIQVRGIRKHFGHLEALRGIDFELKRGEFLAVFGPNGGRPGAEAPDEN